MKLKTVFRIEYTFTYNITVDSMYDQKTTVNSIDYDSYPDEKLITEFIDECDNSYWNIVKGELKVEKIIITTK